MENKPIENKIVANVLEASSLQWGELKALLIQGKDAEDFLQRMTSQNIKALSVGEAKPSALLNSNSTILNLFIAEKKDPQSFVLYSSKNQMDSLRENLEKFHFAEELEIKAFQQVSAFAAGSTGQPKIIWGQDFTEKNLIQELPLQDFLSRNKGCYPGQEVVERVFTYGQMAKKLVMIDLVTLETSTASTATINKIQATGDAITLNGEKVGAIIRVMNNYQGAQEQNSKSQQTALAFIKKPHYKNGVQLDQGVVRLFANDFEFSNDG